MSDKDLLLSVVVITYGQAKFIEKTIEGVLMQKTSFPFEFIIANDASPDNSDEVIRSAVQNIPPHITLHYTRHEQNIGMMRNGIWAFSQAKGKYIAYCEGDDYWTNPDKLQLQVDFLEQHQDYGLVYTDIDFYYEKEGDFVRDVYKNKFKIPHTSLADLIEHRSFIAPCSWVIRKDLVNIGSVPTGINDGTFLISLQIASRSRIWYEPTTTAVYRHMEGTASRPVDKAEKNKVSFWDFKHMVELAGFYNQDELKKKLLRVHGSSRVASMFVYRDYEAFQYFKKYKKDIPLSKLTKVAFNCAVNQSIFNLFARVYVVYEDIHKKLRRMSAR